HHVEVFLPGQFRGALGRRLRDEPVFVQDGDRLEASRAARPMKPSGVSSTGEMTMMRYFRPFSHSDVVPAIGAMSTLRCFSVTSAIASVIGEEYGPSTASTRSSVISCSYTRLAVFSSEPSSRMTNSIGRPSTPP